MSYETINPEQALELMRGDPAHVYLDVRSVDEFEQGHAEGAINIPIAHLGPGGMTPNADFLRVATKALETSAPIVVGCKMGGRSARACEALSQVGFTQLKNIDGGFGGRPDAGDPSAQKGWQGSGLPVSTEPAPEQTYRHLEANANG